jgi:hypothetical protein
MTEKESWRPTDRALNQLAGIAGLGWTASFLGFLMSVVRSGNTLVARFGADPRSLLYLGIVCFLVTMVLDRVANAAENEG